MVLEQRYQPNRNNPTAGELRERFKLYKRAETLDATGRNFKTTEKFTLIDEVAGKVAPIKGLVRIDTKQIGQQVTHRMWIRYRTDITDRNWIVWDGRRFNIRDFQPVNERKRFLELLVEEVELTQ